MRICLTTVSEAVWKAGEEAELRKEVGWGDVTQGAFDFSFRIP